MESKLFTFRVINDQSKASGTGKLMNVVEFNGNITDYKRQIAEFRGKLLSLFGEPPFISGLSDEAFDYILEATDEDGNMLILTAYHGASGPAIGARKSFIGGNDELNVHAASDLIALLNATEPTDFSTIVYDDDTDNTVWMGIKNGQYFWREEHGNHLKDSK